jgi:hypothetical protein
VAVIGELTTRQCVQARHAGYETSFRFHSVFNERGCLKWRRRVRINAAAAMLRLFAAEIESISLKSSRLAFLHGRFESSATQEACKSELSTS